MKLKNELLMTVTVEVFKPNGHQDTSATIKVKPGHAKSFDSDHPPVQGGTLRILVTATGSLICTKNVKEGKEKFKVTVNNIRAPWSIPDPDFDDPGHTYLVGQGRDSKENIITREQWWYLTDASASLAPNESRNWTYSYTEGVENSSTSLNTFSSELNTSTSGGWGAVSASLSASLSTSSSTQETVTLSSQTTQSETRSLINTRSDKAMETRLFQVRERYSVISKETPDSMLDHDKDVMINDTSRTMMKFEYTG